MVYKNGSKGDVVKKIQTLLGLTADGIFGPNTEKAVKEWQKKNGLVADGIVGEKTLAAMFPDDKKQETDDKQTQTTSIKIIKKPLSVHITKKANRQPKYLAIHYTAGGSSKQGKALSTYNTFVNRQASADFVVDDVDIVQMNPDINNYYCWAVGDGNGKYGVTNTNTISIEMCSSLKSGASASKANHSGWYITDAVYRNTVLLTKYIMKKYNIKWENVIRHYDASRKYCPGLVGWNDGVLYEENGTKTKKNNTTEKWQQFKEDIKK